MPDSVLEIRGLRKYFPGVQALDSVDFVLSRGEIHALMGENGAGKSTLIKVVTGLYTKDSGQVLFNNEDFSVSSPMEAAKRGISTVYQEINLVPNLSVAENIYIGRQPMKSGMVDWKSLNKKAFELLKKIDIDIDVTQELSSFSIAIQQMVAIARAIDIDARILILDEPTSSLDTAECDQLFSIMNRLKAEGMGIIFITHFLDQVYQVSDRITVLRNGKYVGTFETKDLPKVQLISRMLGREIDDLPQKEDHSGRRQEANKPVLLKAEGISRKGSVFPMDIDIHPKEIVGFAGLLGSGRTETARILFGIDKAQTGHFQLNGKPFSLKNPRQAIMAGFSFCPEDRKADGIIPELSVRENILIPMLVKKGMFRRFSRKKQEEIVDKYIHMLNIKTPSSEQEVGNLSGGNQQKVILARWLSLSPRILILDEPTRGIDVGAKAEIEKIINELRDDGMAVIFISSELDEITRNSDRVVVLRDRKKVAELTGSSVSEDHIMHIIAEGAAEGAEA